MLSAEAARRNSAGLRARHRPLGLNLPPSNAEQVLPILDRGASLIR
jgi:hypothetical protein